MNCALSHRFWGNKLLPVGLTGVVLPAAMLRFQKKLD
jgi:hypothetical protein